jgi:hypothetical protein
VFELIVPVEIFHQFIFSAKSLGIYTTRHLSGDCRDSGAMDGKCGVVANHIFRYMKPCFMLFFYIRVTWIPAQICLEQICINPKGFRQDSLK